MLRKRLLVACGLVVVLGGCKSRNDQVAGMWRGRPGEEFDFNVNHPYVQNTPVATGTWVYNNDRVLIRITKFNGKPVVDFFQAQLKRRHVDPESKDGQAYIEFWSAVCEKVVYTLSDDGKSMTPVDPATNDSGPITKYSDTPLE